MNDNPYASPVERCGPSLMEQIAVYRIREFWLFYSVMAAYMFFIAIAWGSLLLGIGMFIYNVITGA